MNKGRDVDTNGCIYCDAGQTPHLDAEGLPSSCRPCAGNEFSVTDENPGQIAEQCSEVLVECRDSATIGQGGELCSWGCCLPCRAGFTSNKAHSKCELSACPAGKVVNPLLAAAAEESEPPTGEQLAEMKASGL